MVKISEKKIENKSEKKKEKKYLQKKRKNLFRTLSEKKKEKKSLIGRKKKMIKEKENIINFQMIIVFIKLKTNVLIVFF